MHLGGETAIGKVSRAPEAGESGAIRQRILEVIKREPHADLAARHVTTFCKYVEAQSRSFTKKELETLRDQILSYSRFGQQSKPYKAIRKALNLVIKELVKHE